MLTLVYISQQHISTPHHLNISPQHLNNTTTTPQHNNITTSRI
ncbi:MAG: hypothetical protein PUJ38_02460 [Prevotella stercorea]|nr:hypothetical protein [Leyella stercorea]